MEETQGLSWIEADSVGIQIAGSSDLCDWFQSAADFALEVERLALNGRKEVCNGSSSKS